MLNLRYKHRFTSPICLWKNSTQIHHSFFINQNQLKTIVSNWLGKGWFHPQSLSSSATVNSFRGVYLPFWTFDAEINADWKALVGYERSERYYDAGSKEWKTRTTIDWRWEDGQVNQSLDDILIPGTLKVSHASWKKFNPMTSTRSNLSHPIFWPVASQQFDLSLQEARYTAKDKMREKTVKLATRIFQPTMSEISHVRRLPTRPGAISFYRLSRHLSL
jgi:hypothetical protein